jgi:hypothetical protein
VEVFNTGVVKPAPVKTEEPPLAVKTNHRTPPGDVAVRTAVLPIQIAASAAVGAAGIGLTVTATDVLLLAHPETVFCT